MYAQLMAATGDGCQSHPRPLAERIACEHGEMRRRRFANHVINHLPRAVRPIANQRQVDRTRVILNQSVRDCYVVFTDRALLERATDRSLGVNATGEYHQARGFQVESMHD